jgi:hypothetical protein
LRKSFEINEERVVDRHNARYVMFQMAEVAVPRDLFAAILARIKRLRFRPPLAGTG